MSRVTQHMWWKALCHESSVRQEDWPHTAVSLQERRAPVSPEHLPLPASHSCAFDKASWLPEGRVFSNVQREKIISKFLKGSVLKRVFGSQQLRWEGPNSQREDPSSTSSSTTTKAGAQPEPAELFAQQEEEPVPWAGDQEDNKDEDNDNNDDDDDNNDDDGQDTWDFEVDETLREQKNSSKKMGRKSSESGSTSLHVSSISQENLSQWNLDGEELFDERESFSSENHGAAGGKTNQNHLENPAEQLVLQVTVSEHAHSRSQNSNQGVFQLWSSPVNKGSAVDKREFKNSSVETDFNAANSPRLFTVNHLLASIPGLTYSKQVILYPGLSMPAGLCWPYADGDFLKDRHEFRINSFSTMENNNGDSLSASNWNFKYRNSSVEENVTDESDLSENEKMNDSLLSYFKKMDLNLKPERIEHVERAFTEEASQVFVYADFLPAPFNTLDLHRFAFSKCESWKAAVEPPESSIERLIIRLLELERLQHMTIQRERPRLQSTFYSSMFSMAERPSSSKAIALKAKPPKIPETSTLQTSGVDKNRDKRKNNSGSGKPEQSTSKWSLSGGGKSKSNSRALLKCSSTSKQCATAHDDTKNSKTSNLNPCQEPPPKPTTTQATQPMTKVVSTRCLPPRSPMPVSPIPLSFPENPREEGKVPRTKKKCHRKSILLNRAFYLQKRNCLSPSLIARGKCSPTDQK
ncbi:protein FAM217A isoform X2 [Mastomys coucha]|uniref:protein FAM217A isoform X2 n=1 Tax=Mastomys coucha TaxID=35658 RepID=UPI0012615D94|nr:protein FAM217A isoform X2 [Mastomys coucha]